MLLSSYSEWVTLLCQAILNEWCHYCVKLFWMGAIAMSSFSEWVVFLCQVILNRWCHYCVKLFWIDVVITVSLLCQVILNGWLDVNGYCVSCFSWIDGYLVRGWWLYCRLLWLGFTTYSYVSSIDISSCCESRRCVFSPTIKLIATEIMLKVTLITYSSSGISNLWVQYISGAVLLFISYFDIKNIFWYKKWISDNRKCVDTKKWRIFFI